MIAALFVEKNGSYFGIPGIDPWDAERDAMNYGGPHSIVAHPPCQLWTNMAFVNFKRWGGEHNRPFADGGKFAFALSAVRKYGGVLEHPAFTHAWGKYDLARPSTLGWTAVTEREWVCEVWQSAYGHQARKRTWLLYCGDNRPHELNWKREPGTHQIGGADRRGKKGNKPTLSGKKASHTPRAFRDELIKLAVKSQRKNNQRRQKDEQ